MSDEFDEQAKQITDLRAEKYKAAKAYQDEIFHLRAELAETYPRIEKITADLNELNAKLIEQVEAIAPALREAEKRGMDRASTIAEAIRAERDKLRAKLTEAIPVLKEVMDWHRDEHSSDYNECEIYPCAWCRLAAKIVGDE